MSTTYKLDLTKIGLSANRIKLGLEGHYPIPMEYSEYNERYAYKSFYGHGITLDEAAEDILCQIISTFSTLISNRKSILYIRPNSALINHHPKYSDSALLKIRAAVI